jgi:DNA-binding transcriptional MerR regulator
MELMTIGDFAARTRLSAKALRLYDRLGLLRPAQTDPVSGYRRYSAEQVEAARLAGLLRRLGMPLSAIADVLAMTPAGAAEAIEAYWAGAEAETADRRALASYLQARLKGADMTSYDIATRTMPARTVLSISRHLHASETGAFFGDAFARLRAAGPGLPGIEGCPYLIFYGEVSEDSDGPLELCRPLASGAGRGSGPGSGAGPDLPDAELRTEPAHDEAYIRLAMKDLGWPALLPAADALEAWTREQGRAVAGPLRQVLFGDQRTAAPGDLVCDLTVPLK